MKYQAVVRETWYRVVEIEANSPEEAEEMVREADDEFADEPTFECIDSVDVAEIA